MIVTSVSGSSSTPYSSPYRAAIASRKAGKPRNGGYPCAACSFARAASSSITCCGGPTSGFPRPRSTSGSPSIAACRETSASSAVKYCCGRRSTRSGGGRICLEGVDTAEGFEDGHGPRPRRGGSVGVAQRLQGASEVELEAGRVVVEAEGALPLGCIAQPLDCLVRAPLHQRKQALTRDQRQLELPGLGLERDRADRVDRPPEQLGLPCRGERPQDRHGRDRHHPLSVDDREHLVGQ